MEQIKEQFCIERKKEIAEIFEWLETRFVLINIMTGKNHRIVCTDQKYWDRISYYINDQLVIELGIYHNDSDIPRLGQWNYYLDIYDRNMINKCNEVDIKCSNIFVDTIHDIYRILEVAFK